ncbi:N-acetylmuramoyl-L-alanine amidase [Nocardioides sp. zg-ZUI104]|uniref:N-acetylmuramoyl-L-alanine amidase family protein n=1 Tax=Nocardioides faecalis TaxID=2803858 RepID=UPI001BCFB66D|nr:N-acetylmuramoyl-L-alanine amidase [Nocardioides faecalis]MBS4753321.1 N-acetylmuramoyl-L-alanine amidase [Nocardioides faecalis]
MTVRLLPGAAAAALVLSLLAAGCGDGGTTRDHAATTSDAPGAGAPASGSAVTPTAPKPLAGKVVVLDPGHQLGNRNHAARINAPVDAGGFTKPCNTTGTATNAGYPEATFTWEVAGEAKRMLRRLGARVLMTRKSNSDEAWGPCLDVRGTVGNPGAAGPTADLRISIHADGVTSPGARGFHIIAPGARTGRAADLVAPSRRLAEQVRDALVRAGFSRSTYTGSDGIAVRDDLGTLNHSAVPAVMVELANMRHPGDAVLVTDARVRARYARALVRAVRGYLGP